MNMQQYKYRRKFPYNDTINEESAENLSENKSTLTFTSKGKRRLFQEMSARVMNKTKFSLNSRDWNKSVIKSHDFEEVEKQRLEMRSVKMISEFKCDSTDELIHIEGVSTDSKPKVSDRFIRSFEELPVGFFIFLVNFQSKNLNKRFW